MSTDYMRTEYQANQVSYNVLFFAEDVNFVPIFNNVTVTGLPSTVDEGSTLTNEVPLITFETPSELPLDILLDIQTDDLSISVGGENAFTGNFADFAGDAGNLGFLIDFNTCRRISKVHDQTARSIETDLPSLPEVPRILGPGGPLAKISDDHLKDTINVFDQNGNPISWEANYRGFGISLESNTGNAGDPVVVMYSNDGVMPIPATNIAFVDITSPDAINNPKVVPVSVRYDSTMVTGIEDAESAVPTKMNLAQNYPNPFNPSTVINFSLTKKSDVKLKIYDTLGKEIKVLVNESLNAGNHEVKFNAENLSSGIYFYQINAGDFVETKKMILMK